MRKAFFLNSCFAVRKSNFRDAKNLAQSHIMPSSSTSIVESKTVAVYMYHCPASLECPNSISHLADPLGALFSSLPPWRMNFCSNLLDQQESVTKADSSGRKIPV